MGSFRTTGRLIFLIAVLSMSGITFGQTSSPSPSPANDPKQSPSLEHEFFKNILHDQKAIWTSPFQMHRRDARWAVPLGLGTMALITTDRMTGDEMAESDGPLHASHVISYAGSFYGAGGVAAAFYLTGRQRHDYRARETGLLASEALIDSVIVVTTLKGVTQRARPAAGHERSEFLDGGSSFPSGHSISAWSVATVIADEYHDRPLVKVAAYGIAGAVSIARFTGQKHYLSDVLVGSVLGYGIGHYVYHARHRTPPTPVNDTTEDFYNQKNRWPSLAPLYDRRRHEYGMAIGWDF